VPDALIIAHGQPSDPAPQEAAVVALAARVQALAPGWRVRGATLAAGGAVEAALAGLAAPVVVPFFMAEGFFTRTQLPRRLAGAGAAGLRITPAFGHLPGLARLAVTAAVEGTEGPLRQTSLLLVAHGSKVSRASAEGARAMAAHIARHAPFGQVLTAFVEEPPSIAQAARGLGRNATVLPFFALRAGHVAEDVPKGLAAAGFRGVLLPALGEHPGAAGVIAAALV
jgi:sirohydrochlorin ferrochelatase